MDVFFSGIAVITPSSSVRNAPDRRADRWQALGSRLSGRSLFAPDGGWPAVSDGGRQVELGSGSGRLALMGMLNVRL